MSAPSAPPELEPIVESLLADPGDDITALWELLMAALLAIARLRAETPASVAARLMCEMTSGFWRQMLDLLEGGDFH